MISSSSRLKLAIRNKASASASVLEESHSHRHAADSFRTNPMPLSGPHEQTPLRQGIPTIRPAPYCQAHSRVLARRLPSRHYPESSNTKTNRVQMHGRTTHQRPSINHLDSCVAENEYSQKNRALRQGAQHALRSARCQPHRNRDICVLHQILTL